MSSKKYEYLAGEDLGYKAIVIEQAKFDYYSLSHILNKGLTKEGGKEGLFKRLENNKSKNEELLKAIKDQRIQQSGSKKLRQK